MEGHAIWRSRVPLVCFEIVEMHVPDRVLRQFGFAQHAPQFVERIERKAFKGGHQIDWPLVHIQYIHRWNDRHGSIVEQLYPPMEEIDYIRWYWGITRRWIITQTTPPVDEIEIRSQQARYVPRGVDDREWIDAMDEIEGIANEGISTAGGDTVHISVLQRIVGRVRKALHRTHEDRHEGREQMVHEERVYARRRRRGESRSHDNEAGPSQPHTQPESEHVQAQVEGGRRRSDRVRRGRQRGGGGLLGCM